MGVHQPQQQRRGEAQRDIFGRRIDADGAGPLAAGKPGADDVIVGGKTGRLEQAQRQPPAEQRGKAGGGGVHQGGERPAGNGDQIDQPRAEPVQRQPPGIWAAK